MSKFKIIIIYLSLCFPLVSFGQTKIDSLEKVLNTLAEDTSRVDFRNDSNGNVNEWSQSAEMIAGFTKDEVMGNNHQRQPQGDGTDEHKYQKRCGWKSCWCTGCGSGYYGAG